MNVSVNLRLSALLCCSIGCSRAELPARIEFQSETVDLGVLDPGESPFTIRFENGGGKPLHVSKVSSTCACTQAEATEKVPSGGKGWLAGKIKVQGGPGGAVLTLETNAPGNSKLIHLRWFGKSSPTIQPNALEVRLKVHDTASRRIEVSYPAGDPPIPMKFLGASGLPAGASLVLESDDPRAIVATPGLNASPTAAASPYVGRSILRLNLPPADSPGTISSNCLVHVELVGKSFELPLDLLVKVDEGIRAKPAFLMFSGDDFESLKKITRKVMISSEADLNGIAIVEKPDFLHATLSTSGGASPTMVLTARVASPPPSDQGDRRIVLQDSSGKQVSVAVLIGMGR